jgi:hypothetical protein
MAKLVSLPDNTVILGEMLAGVSLARSVPFNVDLLPVISRYYKVFKTVYPDFHKKAATGDRSAAEWVKGFTSLGEKLSIELTSK